MIRGPRVGACARGCACADRTGAWALTIGPEDTVSAIREFTIAVKGADSALREFTERRNRPFGAYASSRLPLCTPTRRLVSFGYDARPPSSWGFRMSAIAEPACREFTEPVFA